MTSRFRLALIVGSLDPGRLRRRLSRPAPDEIRRKRAADHRPQGQAQAPGRRSARRSPASSAPTPSTSMSRGDRASASAASTWPTTFETGRRARRSSKRRSRRARRAAPRSSGGGYALYRQHCLHCHGVSGAGDGPTRRSSIPGPATTARASSSSPRRPHRPEADPRATCARRSATACTGPRCPPSRRSCRPPRSSRSSTT